MRYTRIHTASAQVHDANCRGPDSAKTHYRVTRPDGYASPNCPGHLDPSARQGYYTDACCPTQAARIILRRRALDATYPDPCCDKCSGTGRAGNETCKCITDNVREDKHIQPFDVQVWR